MSMTDGRFKARQDLQRWVCPPAGRFRDRLLMDHRCYPPYKEKDHTGIGAKHSCLACESGQETACPDQYDF